MAGLQLDHVPWLALSMNYPFMSTDKLKREIIMAIIIHTGYKEITTRNNNGDYNSYSVKREY